MDFGWFFLGLKSGAGTNMSGNAGSKTAIFSSTLKRRIGV
jgi:hypothetical protein